MKYEFAPDLQAIAEDVSSFIFPHVDMTRVKCFRSSGSSTKRTIARCHGMSKIIQKAMGVNAWYALEFLVKHFEKLSIEDKIKTIVHELMHIPYNFGGGFKHHDHVTERNVNKMYNTYLSLKRENENKKNCF